MSTFNIEAVLQSICFCPGKFFHTECFGLFLFLVKCFFSSIVFKKEKKRRLVRTIYSVPPCWSMLSLRMPLLSCRGSAAGVIVSLQEGNICTQGATRAFKKATVDIHGVRKEIWEQTKFDSCFWQIGPLKPRLLFFFFFSLLSFIT